MERGEPVIRQEEASADTGWTGCIVYQPLEWDGVSLPPPELLKVSDLFQPFYSTSIRESAQKAEETKIHRQEVDAEKWRRRIRRDAQEEERADRHDYLTSDEGQKEASERFSGRIVNLDDLPEPEPLIDGFLFRDSLVRTFGAPKSLKSFVTLDMAASVSLGIEWMGHRTSRTKVLYIAAEGVRGLAKRRDAWNEAHEADMDVIFYPAAVNLGSDSEVYELIAFCRIHEVGYVVIDTQARCTVGVEENDNTEMGLVVAALDSLKDATGACVHLVHHSSGANPQKARGATAWDGALDAEFYTIRDWDTKDRVILHTKFQKDADELDPIEMRVIEVGRSIVLDQTETAETGGRTEVIPSPVSPSLFAYLEAINQFGRHGASVKEIREDLAESGKERAWNAVKKAFVSLEACGAVERAGKGTSVAVTQAGLKALDEHRRRNLTAGSGQMGLDDDGE